MKLRYPSLAWIFLGLFAVLAPVTSMLAAEFKGDAKVLAQLDDAWSAAAGQRDVDRVVSFYAADAVAYPPGASAARGTAAIHTAWEGIKDPNYSVSWRSTVAEVASSGEVGFTSGTFDESIKGTDGKVTHSTGKFLCIWKKQRDGSWKAVHDMWNYDGK